MHDHAAQPHAVVGIFGTSAGGAIWWVMDELHRHGPSWSLVPPILLALASLVGAAHTFAEGRHRRRLEAEDRSRRWRLPTYDQIEGRN